MLSDDMIKQVFFYTENKGGPVGEVDILDFARKIEAVLIPTIKLQEHQRCVKIVSDLNSEVGKRLHSLRP
jgi:hypothetical protein